MSEFPRDNLARSASFELTRASEESDGLTLEGYGAVFDSPTTIDSWEGRFTETLARGSFAKTLQERTPVIQFDHGHHPLVGSIPIGSIETLREDDQGLFLRARLHDNWMVQPVRDAIASQAISGMSFRFSVVKESIDESGDMPARTIQEVKLYEVGPVVFPAYESTSVGVRSQVAAFASDPDALAELARALLLGTPTQGAADPALEPLLHSGMTFDERARLIAMIREGVKL